MTRPIVKRSGEVPALPSRRPGIHERRLLLRGESTHQNHILCEADEGAFVEDHPVPQSEAFYVLAGEIHVFSSDYEVDVGPGDFIYFEPGASHGMRVTKGPARYLVVFALGADGTLEKKSD